jgi:glycine cleavage system H protein
MPRRQTEADHTSQIRGETMSHIPPDLRYSEDHLWVRPSEDAAALRVGITDFAQQALGDVVDVTLAGPNHTINANEACGEVESTKSVSDLVAPVTGTVRTRNEALDDNPEAINADPYGQGWMLPVSAVAHKPPIDEWKGDWAPGVDPQHRDYARAATFADPDGNTWTLQEIGFQPTNLCGSVRCTKDLGRVL